VRDGLREAREDRDAVGCAVEQSAGVRARMAAVDHAEDVVLLGMADQSVGRLSVLLAELSLAVDDRCRTDRKHRERGRRGV
jgi:hypothetical protein